MSVKQTLPPPLPTAAPRVGRESRARAEERIGSLLDGKWRLDELLGVGGMSVVYAATHRNGKRVAVKVLRSELCNEAQLVARFLREGYVANKLDHPCSVSILDDGKGEDGEVYLVMDLVRGHSLDRYVKPGGPRLTSNRVLKIFDDVLDLLAAAHASGIVHRDIKPANILITDTDVTKVLDFGIARLNEQTGLAGVGEGETQNGTTMGTPAYMPPEQARGRWNQVDGRSDLWSVGATMFALLVGDRPRHAETVQEELLLAMTQAIPPLEMVLPGVPPPLARFIDTATAMNIEARFQDARSMQGRLRELLRNTHTGPSALAARVDIALRLNTPSVPINIQFDPRSTDAPPPLVQAVATTDTAPPSSDIPSRSFGASTGTIPEPGGRTTRRSGSHARLSVVTGFAALLTAGAGILVWGRSSVNVSRATSLAVGAPAPTGVATEPAVYSAPSVPPAATTPLSTPLSTPSRLPIVPPPVADAAAAVIEAPLASGSAPSLPPRARVEPAPGTSAIAPSAPDSRARVPGAPARSASPRGRSSPAASSAPSVPPSSAPEVPADTKANPLDERL